MSLKRFRRSGALLSAVALTLAAASVGAQTPDRPRPSTGAPNIEITETTKDAGQVIRGESINYVFDVKNTGTSALEILEARPSCGCTVADFDRTVPAGGTGKIRAVIDTNKVSTGPMSKSITVRSNDPDQPQVFLQLKALVTAYVEIFPATVNIRTDRGTQTTEKVILRASSGNAIGKIEKVESTLPFISSKFYRVDKADPADAPTPYKAQAGDHRIELTVGPDAPLGPQNGLLRVYTNSAKTPKVEVPVSVMVSRLVQAIPEKVNFRLLVPPDQVRPLANGVVVREAPDTKAREVSRIGKESTMRFVEEREGWIHLAGANGLDGWVQKRNVSREPAPPSKVAGSTNVRTVSVMRKSGTDFRVERVEVDPALAPDLAWEVKPLKEGQTYSITLTYKGGMIRGTRSGLVTIFTNDKNEGRVEVPISITIS